QAVGALQERMEAHNALLRGAAGLFAGSDDVDAREFAAYVDRLGLGTRYPGVLGIGYAARGLGESGRATVEADMRRQGFNDFRIWPEGRRGVYTGIVYLWPMNARNRAAIGYDMYTEPTRREAMARAAASGQLAMSGKVELIQETEAGKQPGFLVYLAVRASRTAPVEGFIYSPLRAHDLFSTVFPDQSGRLVDVALYDGTAEPANRLFTTASDSAQSRLTAQRQIAMAGRVWTLTVGTRPAFEEGSHRGLAVWWAAAGALVTLALTLAVLVQARGALAAERARADLRTLNASLEDRVEARTRELRDEAVRREAAEEQMRHLQKMDAIGQLSGGIAHDFNNMLAIVVGSLDMAKRRMTDGHDPRVASYIDNAAEGARRAAVLTGRLLAFARRQQLSPEPLDPNQLINGMTELLQRSLGDQVHVETALAKGVWPVFADAAELENALLNLAVNARDAMTSGGRLTIATRNVAGSDSPEHPGGERLGDHVLLEVSDTGAGMSRDVMARAFEPFFTTKEVGRGTGLGLSQVYGFVSQSGGQVSIASTPGRGTTISVRLPRWQGAKPSPQTRAPGETPRARPGEFILVVEDEGHVRRLSVETLRELGYGVAEAADGEQALKVLASLPRVDLLFSDILMPGMNGLRLASRARQIRPDLRVLYTTGFARDATTEEGLRAPPGAVISKPFGVDQLAAKVREILDAPPAPTGA
ncbi:MAG: CHASE domain-containing protein, partial [Phenylobacterium sp.]|nr:CHASE domain-containing protein [Phenylobacterium sp.]